MIAVILRQFLRRAPLLLLAAAALYALEPGFHQHEEYTPDAVALGPLGVSATLSYLAAFTMIILLAGFVSGERREGYTRIHLSNPMTPVGYYGLRWVLAFTVAIGFSAVFLVVGQLIAWGTFRGGGTGLLLPALSALVYGGLMALFSVASPRGDAWIVFILLVIPTFFPEIYELALGSLTPLASRLVSVLMPPHNALADVWNALLDGAFAGGAVVYAAGYGLLVLVAAGVILNLREWP